MRHHPGGLVLKSGIEVPQSGDPRLDVAALSPPHLALSGRRQVGQIAVLNPDEVRLVEGEVEMEFDQPSQRCGRVRRGIDDGLAACHEPGAHLDQQFDQQRLFVGKVPVDGGPADPGRGPNVLQAHCQETPFGDQLFGGGEQLRAAVRLLPVARGDGPSRMPLDELS